MDSNIQIQKERQRQRLVAKHLNLKASHPKTALEVGVVESGYRIGSMGKGNGSSGR